MNHRQDASAPVEHRTRPVALSGRLQAISGLAGTGGTVCDVGCDHAHIPIRLLQEKRFSRAIGMDVIEGPLGKAAGNLRLYGMEDRVELRLSDGLDAFHAGEADTLIVAGMGGSMIEEILLREPEKTQSFQAMVLGPQSDPDKVRRALRTLGFAITEERFLFEDGKYYAILRACRDSGKDSGGPDNKAKDECGPDNKTKCYRGTDSRTKGGPETENKAKDGCGKDCGDDIRLAAEDLFGPVLLRRQDPVLHEYLIRQRAVLEKILRSVRRAAENAAGDGAEGSLREAHLARQAQIERSLEIFRAALDMYE